MSKMINNERLEKFLQIMKNLVEYEKSTYTTKADKWLVPVWHEERQKLWDEMSEDEKEFARFKLGENARWL